MVAGLVLSVVASRVFAAAQPALLYLVPCIIAPIAQLARRRHGHFELLWFGFEEDLREDDHDEVGDVAHIN